MDYTSIFPHMTPQTITVVDALREQALELVQGDALCTEIRGQIIDTKTGTIVCPSYGPVPYSICNHLLNTEGKIEFRDENDQVHIFDPEDVTLERGYEGTILRVWHYGDQTYYSTHRKINASKSRWVVTATFYEMYEKLGGPTDLFKDTTAGVYFFLVVHPQVQVVASKDIGSGRIIFLHSVGGDKDEALRAQFPRDAFLTIKEAEALLADTSVDYRMSVSDFIILSTNGKNYRICSQGYFWRNKMRRDEPNIKNLWYLTLNDVVKPDSEYRKIFPILKYVDIETVKEMVETGTVHFELSNSNTALTYPQRLWNTFCVFLHVLSPSCRRGLLDIYENQASEIEGVVNWLCKIYDQIHRLNPRVRNEQLRTYATKGADRVVYLINYVINKVNSSASKVYIKKNIELAVRGETGQSLYHLIKASKQQQR